MESRNVWQFRNTTVTTRNLNETLCNTSIGIEGNSGRLKLIQGYACFTAFTLCVLAIFGSVRRRNHCAVFRYAIKGAHLLTIFLVSYTIGLMQLAQFRDELFPVWGLFFGVVVGGTDTITVFSLDENEKKLECYVRYFTVSFWIGYLISTNEQKEPFNYKPLIYVLYFLTFLRVTEKHAAIGLASKSGRGKNSKDIWDYMFNDQEPEANDSEDNNPGQIMRECIYLVTGEFNDLQVTAPNYRAVLKTTERTITVGKVWECRGKLLSLQDEDGELKDVFLSYALFKLLCRRFSELPFAESSLTKTWNFVSKGLLHGNDVERAFLVIEVELAFLYDFFYTKYPIIFDSVVIKLRILEVISVTIGIWLGVRTIISYFNSCGYHNVDVLVTGIVILAITIVEIVQLVFIIYSDWFKLRLLSKYVTEPSWQEEGIIGEVIRFICRLKRFKPWGQKLGQYSLLKSLQPTNIFVKAYRYATTIFEEKERRGITQGSRIDLPVQVKKAVTDSLRGLKNRKLTNGVTCLNKYVENGVIEPDWKEEILQACGLKTQTEVILVWHIATSLCENEYLKERRPISDAFITATSLSNYCAYLVGFAPQLLPDNVRTTEVIFLLLIIELKQYFQRCNMSLTELYRQLENESMNTITERGVRLACLLVQIHPVDSRWKVLSEFWAELMLFLSPSDDYNAHAEYLAMGGEFMTHLWALLSHAGILHRPSSEPQVQQMTATRATTQENDLRETVRLR